MSETETDPFESDLIESMNSYRAKAVVQDIEFYSELVKDHDSRLERWFPWFVRFALVLFLGLGVFDLIIGEWWGTLFQLALAIVQVFNLRSVKRTRTMRAQAKASWQAKLDKAEEQLRELDPTNPRFTKIIEEEP